MQSVTCICDVVTEHTMHGVYSKNFVHKYVIITKAPYTCAVIFGDNLNV